MKSIAGGLSHVRQQIDKAAINCGRDSRSIQLLAVSKTQPEEHLRAAYELGQTAFGENYLQEARNKQQALADLDIEWHFIGPIQSNKTREIAASFDWVHSVDRLKIARRLSEQRPVDMPPLNICLQINVDQEESKSGILLEDLADLVEAIRPLPNIKLRGLMAIPAVSDEYQQQFTSFMQLSKAIKGYPEMDTLSMGMSGDMDAAIAAGSTIVRIGTAIFGQRERR